MHICTQSTELPITVLNSEEVQSQDVRLNCASCLTFNQAAHGLSHDCLNFVFVKEQCRTFAKKRTPSPVPVLTEVRMTTDHCPPQPGLTLSGVWTS